MRHKHNQRFVCKVPQTERGFFGQNYKADFHFNLGQQTNCWDLSIVIKFHTLISLIINGSYLRNFAEFNCYFAIPIKQDQNAISHSTFKCYFYFFQKFRGDSHIILYCIHIRKLNNLQAKKSRQKSDLVCEFHLELEERLLRLSTVEQVP